MRRLLFPALVLMAGVLIFFAGRAWKAGPTNGADHSGVESLPDASPSEVATSNQVSSATPVASTDKAASKLTPQDGTLGMYADDLKPTVENADRYLAAKGRTPFNLLAAFSATGDERYLKQALEQFPNEPAALYVALADAPRGPERDALIERYKAADANNPLPWVFSAAELFEDGRAIEAVEELREALKRPGFYTYFNERAAALREFAVQSGAGAYAAESMAFFSQKLPHLSAATKASRGLQGFVDAQIASAGDTSTPANVNLLYDLGRMFQTPEAARLLVGQLVGYALEDKALQVAQKLPEYPLPVAPGPRTKELAELRTEAKALAAAAARVPAEPALWQGYFSRFRSDGEIAALRWVQQQPVGGVRSEAQPAAGVTGGIN